MKSKLLHRNIIFILTRINVKVRRLGGGFGAKLLRNTYLSSASALAAYKLKKPVKMMLSLQTNMNMLGKRHPFYMTYEVGVNSKGVIQYMTANLYSDYGSGGNEVIDYYLTNSFKSVYNYSTWNFVTQSVVTDMPPNAFTRAPGKSFQIFCFLPILFTFRFITPFISQGFSLLAWNSPSLTIFFK